jgi:alkanesulfonate monooxygenase SsuD/methylene tetrahydromethanopterin reductase-like flavin-dependent oxidoreductase (luciferase family)
MVLPFVSSDGTPLSARGIADGARRIESAGFDGCWGFDSIGRGFALPDPLIALSVAATACAGLEVGTCILQVPLRPPVELAYRILTAQLVCGGRLVLGVGAGSTSSDYEAVGIDFTKRFELFASALPLMRRLWAGERVGGAQLSPWPTVVGGPPVLIGSWRNDAWIRRAAQDYEGWIASAARTSWKALEHGIKAFREAGGKRAVVANVAVELSDVEASEDVPSLRCSPKLARQRLDRLRALGFDDVILVSFDQRAQTLDAIRALL